MFSGLRSIRIFVVLMLVLSGFGFSGCGGGKKEVSFVGKWKHIAESEVTGARAERILTVMTDGPRYRIETGKIIKIYDGSQLHIKYVSKTGSSKFRSKAVTGARVTDPMFWRQRHHGKSKTGTPVAGRETVLYQGRMNRPDGEFTGQYWFDSKTNVLLKSIESVYSKQVSMMVTETTYECQEIEYTDLEDEVFTTQYAGRK